MKFRAVVFDFDGVLIDSEIVNVEAGARGFAAFGYSLTQEDRAVILGRHSYDYTKIFQQRLGFEKLIIEPLRQKINEEYDRMFGSFIRLKPGVKEIIEFLKARGVQLSIATGNELKNVKIFIHKFGFEDVFDYFTTFEDVTRRKPDPEVYIIAKEKTGIPTEQTIAIEDTEIGVEAVKGAGLVCVAIPTENTKVHNFSRADYVFNSIQEVEKLFI